MELLIRATFWFVLLWSPKIYGWRLLLLKYRIMKILEVVYSTSYVLPHLVESNAVGHEKLSLMSLELGKLDQTVGKDDADYFGRQVSCGWDVNDIMLCGRYKLGYSLGDLCLAPFALRLDNDGRWNRKDRKFILWNDSVRSGRSLYGRIRNPKSKAQEHRKRFQRPSFGNPHRGGICGRYEKQKGVSWSSSNSPPSPNSTMIHSNIPLPDLTYRVLNHAQKYCTLPSDKTTLIVSFYFSGHLAGAASSRRFQIKANKPASLWSYPNDVSSSPKPHPKLNRFNSATPEGCPVLV